MNSNKAINVFLVLAGLVGILVGVGLTFFPVEMQAGYDNMISGNISQLSETRAQGTAILTISTVILIGAFRSGWKYIAVFLAAIVFLSYGIGRLVGILTDGVPVAGLLVAMIVELLIGVIALIALRKVNGYKAVEMSYSK